MEVIAILPGDGDEDRAKQLLRNVAAAYDNLAGASFKATRVKPVLPDTEPWPWSLGILQARNVL